jgi:putative transposase
VKPARRKALARWLIDCFRISDRRACRVIQVHRSSWHYRSRRDDQVALKQRIREIAETRNRYGYLRIHALLRREGWPINHKRIYRLYCEMGLQMRHKTPRRRVKAKLREDRQPAKRINDCWSMDFMADQLFDGKKLRVLTIVDNFSRVSPAIGVRHRYTGYDVVRTLEWATKRHGTPRAIRVDNGPEFVSKELDLWAYANDVTLDFSRPGKPTDNAFIESFNARVRQECLNQHWFLSLADARLKINRWRHEYNHDRPHSMLGYLAPADYAEKHSVALEEEQNLGQIFAHVVA